MSLFFTFLCMIVIALYFSLIYPFGLANYIDLSLVEEVLCGGFNLVVLYPSDRKGQDMYFYRSH